MRREFPHQILAEQQSCDGIPTLWVDRAHLKSMLRTLQSKTSPVFEMLYDLTAIDERLRVHREGQPASEFTVVYHLMSFSGNCDFRLKVPLADADLTLPSVIELWPSANWYERETWDMFGINFEGHPNLYRILMPPNWDGHPLRKDFPLTGYVELRYDDEHKRVVYEPVKLTQEYRDFDFLSPW
jgi:NADH-quinone oxidoreductase subunit C/D